MAAALRELKDRIFRSTAPHWAYWLPCICRPFQLWFWCLILVTIWMMAYFPWQIVPQLFKFSSWLISFFVIVWPARQNFCPGMFSNGQEVAKALRVDQWDSGDGKLQSIGECLK